MNDEGFQKGDILFFKEGFATFSFRKVEDKNQIEKILKEEHKKMITANDLNQMATSKIKERKVISQELAEEFLDSIEETLLEAAKAGKYRCNVRISDKYLPARDLIIKSLEGLGYDCILSAHMKSIVTIVWEDVVDQKESVDAKEEEKGEEKNPAK